MSQASPYGVCRGAGSCLSPFSNYQRTPRTAGDGEAVFGVESKRARRDGEDGAQPDLEGRVRARRAAIEAEWAQRQRDVGPFPEPVQRLLQKEVDEALIQVRDEVFREIAREVRERSDQRRAEDVEPADAAADGEGEEEAQGEGAPAEPDDDDEERFCDLEDGQ